MRCILFCLFLLTISGFGQQAYSDEFIYLGYGSNDDNLFMTEIGINAYRDNGISPVMGFGLWESKKDIQYGLSLGAMYHPFHSASAHLNLSPYLGASLYLSKIESCNSDAISENEHCDDSFGWGVFPEAGLTLTTGAIQTHIFTKRHFIVGGSEHNTSFVGVRLSLPL